MTLAELKACRKASCSMRNIEVTVEAETCLSCGGELTSVGAEWMQKLLDGAGDLSGLFGKRKP